MLQWPSLRPDINLTKVLLLIVPAADGSSMSNWIMRRMQFLTGLQSAMKTFFLQLYSYLSDRKKKDKNALMIL